MTGLVYHERFLDHYLGYGHPESPARLIALIERLEASGLLDRLYQISPATDLEELDAYIGLVHSPRHIESVLSTDVTGDVARLAVAGVIQAVDLIAERIIDNGFCAIRPPGHHAQNNGAHFEGLNQGQGFCFFNNIAIAAKYAKDILGYRRILILDWDYHHGNGTELAFYDDPDVLYFSTHVLNTYPGTGYDDRNGQGAGKGYNFSIPLPSGAGDREVIGTWKDVLLPSLTDLQFRPDFVMVSAGFDSGEHDYLGTLRVSDHGFGELTDIAWKIAREHAEGRLLSVLEGGYNPQALAASVETHLNHLLKGASANDHASS